MFLFSLPLRQLIFISTADVYSFAIILKEIITRMLPYESSSKEKILEPNEILDRVRMGIIPPYRPEVVSPDCPNNLTKVVQACWQEDPSHRPDFTKLKGVMRKISQGISSRNFLDNLLNRMEQVQFLGRSHSLPSNKSVL